MPPWLSRPLRAALFSASARDLNRALHTVTITRLRCHPETRAYETERTAQGKTHRDVGRSVKQALARRLYRCIQAAAQPAAQIPAPLTRTA